MPEGEARKGERVGGGTSTNQNSIRTWKNLRLPNHAVGVN